MNVGPIPVQRPLGTSRSCEGRRVEERLAAVATAVAALWESVAELDRSGAWAVDGARSLASWISSRAGIGIGHASGIVAAARGSVLVPDVLEALAAGDLSEPKARLLLQVCTPERHEYVERDLPLLLSQAVGLRYTHLSTALARWAARVDAEQESAAALADAALVTADGLPAPELPDPSERASSQEELAHRLRRFDLGSPCLGNTVFDGILDTDGDLIVRTAIERWLRSQQPDVAERLSDQRSASQQRADALVGIARSFLSMTGDEPTGGERPTVNVIVDLDVLEKRIGGIAVTDRDRHLSQSAIRRMCCDAKINRIVMAGPSTVLDVGRTTRTPPTHLRRAVVIRDRHCRFPECSMPARFTDAHHIVHWADGGHTNTTNLVLLCAHHHRQIHEGGWKVRGDANGPLTFTHPHGDTITEATLRSRRPPDP